MCAAGGLSGNRPTELNVGAFSLRGALTTVLFSAPVEFTPKHEAAYLVHGEFIEFLARVADEYFRASTTLTTLDGRLRLVVDQLYLTVAMDPSQPKARLPALREGNIPALPSLASSPEPARRASSKSPIGRRASAMRRPSAASPLAARPPQKPRKSVSPTRPTPMPMVP